MISTTNKPSELQSGGSNIEQVHSYSQLGLILKDKLNWEDHKQNIIYKANKKIGLKRKVSNDLPRFAFVEIYTVYIRPQLEYAAVIITTALEAKATD